MLRTNSKTLIDSTKILLFFALVAGCVPPLAASTGCNIQNAMPASLLTPEQLQNLRGRFTGDPNDDDIRKEVLSILQSIDANQRSFAVDIVGIARGRNADKINEDFDKLF